MTFLVLFSLVKAFILFSLLVLFGCERTDPLTGTKWTLQSLYGHPPLDRTTITIEFSNGYVRGSAGCNDYFTVKNIPLMRFRDMKYQISDDGSLIIPGFGQTIDDCMYEELMRQEDEYLSALGKVAEYRLVQDQLELKNGTGDTILIFTK